MRRKNAFRNIIFGLVNRGVILLVPFFMIIMLKEYLGNEYVGLNSLFTSLLQMLNLAELGLGDAMLYKMYRPIANNDLIETAKLLKLYKKIYNFLALAIFVIGICCIPFLNFFINGEVPNNIDIHLLFLIYLINTVLSYLMFAYKKSILKVNQRMDVISKINMFVNIVLYLLQFIVLICFKNYYLYILMIPISTLLDNIIVNMATREMFPNLKPYGNVDEITKKEVIIRVKALAGHKIGAVVLNSFDSIVISSFLGLNTLSVYSCYYYIVRALNGFINVIFSSILPGIGNRLVLEKIEDNYKLFKKLTFMLLWIIGFATVCLAVLYQPFIELWMGKEYLLPIHTVILFAVYFYVWQIRIIGLAFKDAAGMWNEDFWKPYLGVFFNIVVNILLVKLIGLDGVLISTIIVMSCINFPWETAVLYKKLFKISAVKYIKRMIFNFVITLLLIVFMYYICSLIKLGLILNLIIRFILCFVIVNISFWIIYHKTIEYKEVVFISKTFLEKRKRKKNEKNESKN